jgi:hypothetical protein
MAPAVSITQCLFHIGIAPLVIVAATVIGGGLIAAAPLVTGVLGTIGSVLMAAPLVTGVLGVISCGPVACKFPSLSIVHVDPIPHI